MVSSSGSRSMSNGQKIWQRLDDEAERLKAEQQKKDEELNAFRDRLEAAAERGPDRSDKKSPTQSAVDQLIQFAHLSGGGMQGSRTKGRSAGNFQFRLLEPRQLPIPDASAISAKTPRCIQPSKKVQGLRPTDQMLGKR